MSSSNEMNDGDGVDLQQIAADQAEVNTSLGVETTAQPQAEKTGKRANWVISHEVSADGGLITWTVKGAGTLKLDVTKLSETVAKRAAVHGMVQRVSDAAAIARDTKTGKSATPQEKFDAMAELVEHYESGTTEWNRKGGERGARTIAGVELLRAAIGLWQPEKSAERIAEFVKGLTKAQVAALLASSELKPHVDKARDQQLRAQGEGVDADELLMSL